MTAPFAALRTLVAEKLQRAIREYHLKWDHDERPVRSADMAKHLAPILDRAEALADAVDAYERGDSTSRLKILARAYRAEGEG